MSFGKKIILIFENTENPLASLVHSIWLQCSETQNSQFCHFLPIFGHLGPLEVSRGPLWDQSFINILFLNYPPLKIDLWKKIEEKNYLNFFHFFHCLLSKSKLW